MTVDPRAATGFGSAEAYDRGRPGYPPEAIRRLAHELGLTTHSTILDLAAGTGKLTRALIPHAARVIAVEPSPSMIGVLRERLPEVDAREGAAEAIPVDDETVDAVFVGQGFHWFRTAEAATEIARVLVPGGGLALLWNRANWTEEDLPWYADFVALSRPHRVAAGEFPAERWRDDLERTGLFEPLTSGEVEWVDVTDTDGFVANAASWSWIANLPDDERVGFLGRVRELIGAQPRLRLRYRTEVHLTRRR